MNLDTVINQIRKLSPLFKGNVAGAAAYAKGVADQVWLDLPSAYVTVKESEALQNESMTDSWQVVHETIGVIVIVDNTEDRRGQKGITSVDELKWDLFKALINWRPDSSIDNPGVVLPDDLGADHSTKGLRYVGSSLVEFDRARLFYCFDFTLDVTVTSDDGWNPTGVPLTEIEMDVTISSTSPTLTVDVPIQQ